MVHLLQWCSCRTVLTQEASLSFKLHFKNFRKICFKSDPCFVPLKKKKEKSVLFSNAFFCQGHLLPLLLQQFHPHWVFMNYNSLILQKNFTLKSNVFLCIRQWIFIVERDVRVFIQFPSHCLNLCRVRRCFWTKALSQVRDLSSIWSRKFVLLVASHDTTAATLWQGWN